MIDPVKNMILIDGKIATSRLERCTRKGNLVMVRYKGNTRLYTYSVRRVVHLTNPTVSDPAYLQIRHLHFALVNVAQVFIFHYFSKEYWHICFNDGSSRDYDRSELEVEESVLRYTEARGRMDYFREIASTNSLQGEDGEVLLMRQYQGLQFVDTASALSCYLYPEKFLPEQYEVGALIYPFGCNKSQKKAVEQAFGNQISVIQGPPGTGKTQTILNIVVNAILRDQSVLVVSNNNSAIDNVLEKLETNQLGFLAAMLGCSENKQKFVETQNTLKKYPKELPLWRGDLLHPDEVRGRIREQIERLGKLFDDQERLAVIRQEFDALSLEWEHYQLEIGTEIPKEIEVRKSVSSKNMMALWQELQDLTEHEPKGFRAWIKHLRLNYHLWSVFRHGRKQFEALSPEMQIAVCRSLFYRMRHTELSEKIAALEQHLAAEDLKTLLKDLSHDSMAYFRWKLGCRYSSQTERPQFTIPLIFQNGEGFLKEYPVVLSTTFSSRGNLGDRAMFDYVIMDESSQVSSDTGILALSCARRAVIVGDSMQLPNVVTDNDKRIYKAVMERHGIVPEYDCAEYSFLESMCRVVCDVPQTLLREHYRCHPQIINFCNQKFYRGELVIMTEDHGEKDVLSAVKTVEGNHSRDRMNQREIDVIRQEVFPKMDCDPTEIGIITPYNNQVNALSRQLPLKVDVATVHKFQGREKDAIVMSTVDDVISQFADDPNLLNVAISRSKKQFCLVTSGNEQPKDSNISDLLGYIEYHNFTVTESHLHSIFDYLYKQYTEQRLAFLKQHSRISEYDSENLTYALLQNVLHTDPLYSHLDIICHQPLGILLRDKGLLTEEERRYASRAGTHLDFVIYNRVNKRLILAVETDGYEFHREGRAQAVRDCLKNHILEKYHIPLLRLSTTGSDERKRVEERLHDVLSEVR